VYLDSEKKRFDWKKRNDAQLGSIYILRYSPAWEITELLKRKYTEKYAPFSNLLGEQMLDIWSGTCGLASALTGHYGNLCYLERYQEAKYVLSTLSAWIEQIKKVKYSFIKCKMFFFYTKGTLIHSHLIS